MMRIQLPFCKRIKSICVGLILAFSSCSESSLEIPDKLQDIVASQKNCTCNPYIDQYLWQNKTVYVLGNNNPACDSRFIYYDGNGKEMVMEPGYTHAEFMNASKFLKHVWKCKE